MNAHDRLPDAAADIFGEGATAELAYDLMTVDVPADSWLTALETARSALGCTYFDWLSAVDEPGTGFRVCAHVAALEAGTVRRLLVRTTVPHEAATLPTATGVYAGADWHERETYEMFGIVFTGHPNLVHLLLPEEFEGHPLRKDFVLAARVAKAWPGAKEPGEPAAGAGHGGPKRRQMLPPGVPDPNEWGPLKGQLPPAPARPARGARAGGAAGGAGGAGAERPARRARSVSEGSASQQRHQPADAPWRAPRPAAEGSEESGGTPAPAEKGGTPAPVEKPAETSAEKPAEKPAPVTEPAPAPAEPAPADTPPAEPGPTDPAPTGPAADRSESDGPATDRSESDRPATDRSATDRPENDRRPEGDA
ncbi:NADH-quinone oxidoreductase subunit C [Streptomyces sp. NPDC012623]|uniref:NADH-quinone oxidoreductase subunit C n=1 Tax=unclassified Streptomyces TaxID=2593676 RepID=UPI003693EA66